MKKRLQCALCIFLALALAFTLWFTLFFRREKKADEREDAAGVVATTQLPTLLKREKSDSAALRLLLEQVLWVDGFFEASGDPSLDYDCAGMDAFMEALRDMIYAPFRPLMAVMQDAYDWSAYYEVCVYDGKTEVQPDPKKLLPDENQYEDGVKRYAYVRYDAAFFDRVFETVFNVPMDRDFVYTLPDQDGNEYTVFYHADGAYYARYAQGGDGAGPKVSLSNFKQQADGTYTVTVDFDLDAPEGTRDLATLRATVGLKELDGDRVWSIYRIDVLEASDEAFF